MWTSLVWKNELSGLTASPHTCLTMMAFHHLPVDLKRFPTHQINQTLYLRLHFKFHVKMTHSTVSVHKWYRTFFSFFLVACFFKYSAFVVVAYWVLINKLIFYHYDNITSNLWWRQNRFNFKTRFALMEPWETLWTSVFRQLVQHICCHVNPGNEATVMCFGDAAAAHRFEAFYKNDKSTTHGLDIKKCK